MHIDLNSYKASLSTLDFFYEKVVSGGIILFDDYGGFKETQIIVDNFFLEKEGHFINFPTGQAIFLKK